ncbi:hypothetical protein SLA2020_368520 [Shorea laevis]
MAVSQAQERNTEISHTLLMGQPQQHQEDQNDYQLSKSLCRLEAFLRFFGFYQHSMFTFSLSWLLFLLLGVALPLLIIQLTYCSACQKYEIKSFDLEILASQSLVAAISLLCISHNLRKYRLRKFLFVDKYHGHGAQFRKDYVKKINVISVIELVGTILFLHAAAKISNRAQALGSVASRWHALVTCSSTDTSQQGVNDSGETINQMGSLQITYSESDLEIGDFVPVPTANQLASYMSFYQKRQAFVMYLLSNPGGLTVYGWRIDRTLTITIVFIEMSLFLFVLGKTITIATD